MKLLSPQHTNAKTAKGAGLPVLSAILYMAPHTISGRNVCPNASDGCRKACLYSAGRGRFTNVQSARIRKAQQFFNDRKGFIEQLYRDIESLKRKAKKLNVTPAIRLNGTSDLNWTLSGPVAGNPDVQFYDYTKSISYVRRLARQHREGINTNYHLTFSRSESNEHECIEALSLGFNVAVVFSGKLPDQYLGSPVIDGDKHDFRFLDPKRDGGYIIGLKAKGLAKRDTSGFVVCSTCLNDDLGPINNCCK